MNVRQHTLNEHYKDTGIDLALVVRVVSPATYPVATSHILMVLSLEADTM